MARHFIWEGPHQELPLELEVQSFRIDVLIHTPRIRNSPMITPTARQNPRSASVSVTPARPSGRRVAFGGQM